jgi:hypothetical protein
MPPFHANDHAHELSRTGSEGGDRVTRACFDATIFKILNPN